MNFKKYYKIYLPVFAIILLGGVFFYIKGAMASANPAEWIAGIAFGGIKSMAFSSIWLIFWIIGKLLAALIMALDTFSRIPVYPKAGVPVVEEIWKIMRDMANMAFIVALVIAAFATIFNTFSSSMAFFKGMNWQQTLVKLLISAVLINFSLTLGVLVLDIAQVPTNMLLKSMGDIAGNLGNGLNPSQFMVGNISDANGVDTLTGVFDEAGGALDATGGALISLIFGIVLLGSFLVCIFTGIAFIIYRIPMIWMLLMFSPLVWVARIFPGGEKSFSDWWSKLIGWAFFLPYYFFFVYLALYLLGNQDRIMKAITLNTNTAVYGPDISVQLIFFYSVVCIILMGGTKMAISWSQSTGAAGKKFFDWADKTAKRMPGLNYLEASKVALKAKGEEIQKKGLQGRWASKIYGGDAGDELRRAKMKDLLGVGAGDALAGVESSTVKDIQSKMHRQRLPEADLRAIANNKSERREKRLAAFEELKTRGQIRSTEYAQAHALYGTDTVNGQKFAEGINYGSLDKADRLVMLRSATEDTTKKKIYEAQANKGELDGRIAREALGLYGTQQEKNDFLDKVKEKKLYLAMSVKADPALGLSGSPPRTIDQLLSAELRTKTAYDIAKIDSSTWAEPNFVNALQAEISARERANPTIPPGPGARLGGGERLKRDLLQAVWTDQTQIPPPGSPPGTPGPTKQQIVSLITP